jgi:LemA family protein
MSKKTTIIVAIVAVIAVIALMVISGYNSLVSKEESVDTAYSNVSVMLERRADLIPNLVNTVKGYMEHETEVIENITTARENLLGAKNIDEQMEANDQLTSSLDALMVVVENYPDLKASENFIQLSDELAGTENRISTARKDYNDEVKSYNTAIKKFPTNILASMFGFEQKEYFEAKESATEVPEVEF